MLGLNRIKNTVFRLIGNSFGFPTELAVRDLYFKLRGGVDVGSMHILQKGTDRGSKYYILRYQIPLMGMGAVMRDALFVAPLAKKYGYKVLIEYDSCGCRIDEEIPNNLWEQFFVQKPTIKDVLSDKNNTVVLGPINARGIYNKKFERCLIGNSNDKCYFYSGEKGDRYRDTLRHIGFEFLDLQPDVKNSFEEQFQKMNSFFGNERVVGVLMREHFSEECLKYITNESHIKVLSYHPRVPNLDETIALLNKTMQEKNVKKVFVSTLYDETIKRFEEVFGNENIYSIDRKRLNSYCYSEVDDLYDYNANFDEIVSGKNHINDDLLYERSKTYLLELFLLSKCNIFVSPKVGGGFIVPLMRKTEFEDIFYLEQ